MGLRPSYIDAVIRAGGAPIIVPLTADDGMLRDLFSRLDGLLLAGGGDIQAEMYGAESTAFVRRVIPVRDRVENLAIEWALEAGRPILAICRGLQMLNVVLGGTLIQDIPRQVPGALRHNRRADAWYGRIAHRVIVNSDSLLYRSLKLDRPDLAVNSLHHQAIGQVAPGLAVSARAEDGIIEGVEMREQRFVVGVQWHPETLVTSSPPMLNLFETFITSARSNAS